MLDFKTEVQPVIENIITEVEQLAATSNYPKAVDTEFWDDIILKYYK